MKILKLFVALSLAFFTLSAHAGSIDYGYNAHGDYVPTYVNGNRVEYGYNAHGDYVPKSIGGKQIQYGYNAHGD